jgi:thiol-disulfide isomerase/thioredoxin
MARMRMPGAVLALLATAGACATSPPAVTRHGGDEIVKIESLRGKVVILNYWATWCQPCMDEIPALVRLAGEYEGRVVLLAINDNDDFEGPPRVARWLRRNPRAFTQYIVYGNDGLTRAYPRRVFPTTYFLDANGEVVEVVEGRLTIEKARALVQSALERSPR